MSDWKEGFIAWSLQCMCLTYYVLLNQEIGFLLMSGYRLEFQVFKSTVLSLFFILQQPFPTPNVHWGHEAAGSCCETKLSAAITARQSVCCSEHTHCIPPSRGHQNDIWQKGKLCSPKILLCFSGNLWLIYFTFSVQSVAKRDKMSV